jgi:ribonuclease III
MISHELVSLEKSLGYQFKSIDLLREALRHSSYVNEQKDPDLSDNERLEFLGDAVLDVVISHMLMTDFPETREGDLSRMRATIVNESQLAAVAQDIGLGRHLLLGRGEIMSSGQEKSSILADALEAVVAAVYLDGGLSAAFQVVGRQFSDAISELDAGGPTEDFKSRLQELVQVRFKTIPNYTVVAESGPDHDKTFAVRLQVGGVLTTLGEGKSKKAAEQSAAGVALQELLADESNPGEPGETDGA